MRRCPSHMRALLLVAVAAALLVSGCAAPSSSNLRAAATDAMPGMDAAAGTALHVTGEDCALAGAVAGNPGVVADGLALPKPFAAADVTWYFDGQTDGQGLLIGNYHAALVCQMGMVGGRHAHMLSIGLVGLAVKPPTP